MLSNAWNRRSLYGSIRTQNDMWIVVYNQIKGDQFNTSRRDTVMKFKKENVPKVSKTKRKVKRRKKKQCSKLQVESSRKELGTIPKFSRVRQVTW